MVNLENPKPLEKGLSSNLINVISKMLRKKAAIRPSTEQLMLSPCLKKIKAKAYFNVGRCSPITNIVFAQKALLNFLKLSIEDQIE